MLEPRLALQIKVSSLVNPNGGTGANKPADMEKENKERSASQKILMCKFLIKLSTPVIIIALMFLIY